MGIGVRVRSARARASSTGRNQSTTCDAWRVASGSTPIARAANPMPAMMRKMAAMSLESYAKFPLLFGPSPIQPLRRLTKHLGGATLWAKRDDMNSAYAFGGNKTRKLEYLVADALAQGCDTLVSIGGVQ